MQTPPGAPAWFCGRQQREGRLSLEGRAGLCQVPGGGRTVQADEVNRTKEMRCESVGTFSSHRSVWLEERAQEVDSGKWHQKNSKVDCESGPHTLHKKSGFFPEV